MSKKKAQAIKRGKNKEKKKVQEVDLSQTAEIMLLLFSKLGLSPFVVVNKGIIPLKVTEKTITVITKKSKMGDKVWINMIKGEIRLSTGIKIVKVVFAPDKQFNQIICIYRRFQL